MCTSVWLIVVIKVHIIVMFIRSTNEYVVGPSRMEANNLFMTFHNKIYDMDVMVVACVLLDR